MNPLLGQVIAVGFNFAPVGWAACNGQLLAIADYQALFTLLGTKFGGDGVNNFGVPDLRGAVAVGTGKGNGLSAYVLGQTGGSETVSLTANQLPSHTHTLGATSSAATTNTPAANSVFAAAGANVYAAAAATAMASSATTTAGGSQPHANIPPVLAVNYIIATEGIYPSQT